MRWFRPKIKPRLIQIGKLIRFYGKHKEMFQGEIELGRKQLEKLIVTAKQNKDGECSIPIKIVRRNRKSPNDRLYKIYIKEKI